MPEILKFPVPLPSKSVGPLATSSQRRGSHLQGQACQPTSLPLFCG